MAHCDILADVLERICMDEKCTFEEDDFTLTKTARSRLCKNMPTLNLSSDNCQDQCKSLLESSPRKMKKRSHSRHSIYRSDSDRSRRRDLCDCICQQGIIGRAYQ